MVKEHPWGLNIKWSFDYERGKERDVEEVYARVLDYCKYGGDNPEYENMVAVMNKVAEASGGIGPAEQEKINTISRELSNKFRQDLYKIYE